METMDASAAAGGGGARRGLRGKHVVFSHCRADAVLARAVSTSLVSALEGGQQPESLVLTGDLPDIAAKSQAFAKADVIALLLSPAFFDSPEVFTEYTAYRGIGIPLVVCRLGEGKGAWPPVGLFTRNRPFLELCPTCILRFHDNKLQDVAPLLQLLLAAVSPQKEEGTSQDERDNSQTPAHEFEPRESNGIEDIRQPPPEPYLPPKGGALTQKQSKSCRIL